MSEFKNFFIVFICFIVWSAGLFLSGYLLSNRIATERINKANNELAEQQQRYERVIESTRAELSDIRRKLSTKVFDNGKATEELSELVRQIRKQKLNIQV